MLLRNKTRPPVFGHLLRTLSLFWTFEQASLLWKKAGSKIERSLLTTSPCIDLALKPAYINADSTRIVYCGKYVFLVFFHFSLRFLSPDAAIAWLMACI